MCKYNNFKEYLKELKEKFNIEEVISRYAKLNNSHKTLCPFHKEKDPSFSVNVKEQYFYCFGCSKGGDVIKFLMLILNKDFMDVINILAKEVNFPVPAFSKESIEKIQERNKIEDILSDTAAFYQKCLSPEVKDYLINNRCFSPELIEEFRLGYAKGGLFTHLIKYQGYSSSDCQKAGVIRFVVGKNYQDYFNGRITFPSIKQGRVVSISARSFGDSQPKYLNLPGELNYLYNEDDLSNDEVILVEGVTDTITLKKNGYKVVALTTSNFQEKFIPKFSKCKTIYVCLDSDNAGNSGTIRVAQLMPEKVKIVNLPQGQDPNDYFKNNTSNEFNKLLVESKDIVRFLLEEISADTDKIELPKKLEPIIKIIAKFDQAQIDAYLNYVIKPRFNLAKADLAGYYKLINSVKKVEKVKIQEDGFEVEKKKVATALFDELVDIVLYDEFPAFLIKKGDDLQVVSQFETEDCIYIPPKLEKIPWILPDGKRILDLHDTYKNKVVSKLDRELYEELYSHHKSVSELPDDRWYGLMSLWDLHSYLLENFQYSPVITFYGVAERGKSRTGKGMIYLAYRGIRIEALREASLIRFPKYFRSSLFFDVEDIWKKAQQNGTEDIILNRFEKGAKVPRVLHPEKAPFNDLEYFDTFGATVIATNEPLSKILETRAIQINTEVSAKKFDQNIVEEELMPLREKLILFRARHLGTSLPEVEKIATGRLGDILRPLMQVLELVAPDKKKDFIELAGKIMQEKIVEKSSSWEAQILNLVFQHYNLTDKGSLAIKVITDNYNNGKEEKFKLTPHKVGNILSSLGFDKVKTSNGASAIVLDKNKIEKLKKDYGYQDFIVEKENKKLIVNFDLIGS